MAEELRGAFPERVLEVREAEAYGDVAPGVRLEIAVCPGCEWLATEELVGRAKGLLEAKGMAGGGPPAAHALRNLSPTSGV
jgi:hypothetical protein